MTDNRDTYIKEQVFQALQQATQQYGQIISIDDADIKLVDLGLDSLKLIEVVFDLEQQFNVQADESAMASLHSVGDVARMITTSVRQAQ
jgi:acyl carrier protein